jgi:hypothetical protein
MKAAGSNIKYIGKEYGVSANGKPEEWLNVISRSIYFRR